MADAIDLRDIHFDVIDTTETRVNSALWEECFEVGVEAFKQSYGLSREDAEAFMGGDMWSFKDDRVNPQHAVEEGRRNPQEITRPYLAVARMRPDTLQEQVVGFAYSADAVTNPVKGKLLVGRWRWLETIAVHPDFQDRGIAQGLGYISFRQAYWGQPASAYTHPERGTEGVNLLERWGVSFDGGKQDVELYPGGPTVEQHRHMNRMARRVARRILRQAGSDELYEKTRGFGAVGKFVKALDRDEDDMMGMRPF